jgi:hypothetical protein
VDEHTLVEFSIQAHDERGEEANPRESRGDGHE